MKRFVGRRENSQIKLLIVTTMLDCAEMLLKHLQWDHFQPGEAASHVCLLTLSGREPAAPAAYHQGQ